jgi:BirA family biotin operon repressor/biotin-[acetyl-CoA-carboxylase] ligase
LIAEPLLAAVLAFEAKGFAALQTAFQKRDVLRDMPVTLSDGRQGTARGVDNTGVLRVETPQGMQLINSAEVRVRPSIEGV